MTEPQIIIDGRVLTQAQAMSVRVAITAFLMQLNNDSKFAYGLGRIGVGYHVHLTEVMNIIMEGES